MATCRKVIQLCNNFNQLHRFQNSYCTKHSIRKLLRHPEDWNQLQRQQRGFRTKKSEIVEKDVVDERSFGSLIKPLGFTVMVCGCSFTGAVIWQYEVMRNRAVQIRKMFENSGTEFKSEQKLGDFRQHISSFWNNLSSGEKLVWTVIGLNVGVFALWRIPQLQRFMIRYFSCSPFAGHSVLSMFLSAFSHQHIFHLVCNMYVFWSFSTVSLHLLNREQMVAVFCSGAVISSFASYVLKTIRLSKVPSVGSSGALFVLLGIVCTELPNQRLTIAFIGDIIPFSFSADSGLKVLILFDVLGVVLKWQIFDHACHLGGALFGIWYAKYGKDLIWNRREKLMKAWHSIRG